VLILNSKLSDIKDQIGCYVWILHDQIFGLDVILSKVRFRCTGFIVAY